MVINSEWDGRTVIVNGQKFELLSRKWLEETWLKTNLDLIRESTVKRRPELHSLVKR